MTEPIRSAAIDGVAIPQAARRLWRNRTLTALVVLSLALGIGVNTTLFSVADALFLDPLPVGEPGRLFSIHTTDVRSPEVRMAGSYPNYLDLRRHAKSFAGTLACTRLMANLTLGSDVHEVEIELATPNYFQVLGLRPALGTAFEEEGEGESVAQPSIVLSHWLWRTRFGADKGVIGRKVLLNKEPFTVAGVMPVSYKGLDRMGSSAAWVSMRHYHGLMQRPDWVVGRRALMFFVVGRLRPGVTEDEAQRELAKVGGELAVAHPKENAGRSFRMFPLAETMVGRRAEFLHGTMLLMLAALVVLFLSLANVINALLSRASVRRREMAVRIALGATRRELIGPLVMEMVFLVALGSALGLVLAWGGQRLLWLLRPEWLTADHLQLSINARVLAFAGGLGVLAGAAASLLPALAALRGDLSGELRGREPGPLRLVRGLPVRHALVIAQVALSLMALVSADLFVSSLRNARAIDPGFDTRSLATIEVNPRRLGMDSFERVRFYQELQQRLARVPRVRSVSLGSNPLLGPAPVRRTLYVPGHDERGIITRVNMIGLRHFETADVLLLRGRDFTAEDGHDSPPVAVVNESLARKYFPGETALGRRIRLFGDTTDTEIVGVARDSMYNGLGDTQSEPCIYLPMLQTAPPEATILVRTEADPAPLVPAISAAVHELNPELPRTAVRPIAETIEEALWVHRLAAAVLSLFAVLALLLASIGVYALTRHFVLQRTGEFGVRMALGAAPFDVVELIWRQCLTLILPGLAIGSVLSFLLARYLAPRYLFGISESAIQPYLWASLLLGAVALVASYLPVRRATRLAPVMALREQ